MDGKRFCGYRNRIVENVCRALWDVEYHMDLSRRLAEPGERFVMRTTPTMTRFRMAPFLRLEKGAPGELETNAASEASSHGRKRPLAAACLMPRSRLTRSVRRYLEDQRVPYAFHTSSQDAGSMEAWRYNSRGWGYLIWCAVKRPGPADCWAHHASFLPCPRIFPLAALAAAMTAAIGAGLSLSGPVLRPDLALSALLLRMLRHDEATLTTTRFQLVNFLAEAAVCAIFLARGPSGSPGPGGPSGGLCPGPLVTPSGPVPSPHRAKRTPGSA